MRELKNKLKSLFCIVFMLLGVFSLCSCSDKKTNEIGQDNAMNSESQDVKKYVEEIYGVADNPIYGRRIAHTKTESGKTTTYDEKIKENSKGGSVFYKTVTPEGKKDGLVCIYLSEFENNGIFLKTNYGKYTTTISSPLPSKNRRYAIVKNDYFVCVELSEKKDSVDADLVYTEEVSIYKLNSDDMEEIYTISRKLESGTQNLKEFEIKSDSEWIIYAAGYGSYTAEGAEFVSTQQDFCNRANDILKSCSIDCISLNKTSWNNRWFGMDIDEKGINVNMVKVDFSTSDPVAVENGDELLTFLLK